MDLIELITSELKQAPELNAIALAQVAREKIGGVKATLFYGSCLRDGITPDAIADLYLLTESHTASRQGRLARFFNIILPPNVVYLECTVPDGKLRAKAAILTIDQFTRLTGSGTFHSYFWARFAQPARIVWAENDLFVKKIANACKSAIVTFATETHNKLPAKSEVFWTEGFRHTYAAELRAEGPDRPHHIYFSNKQRYDFIFDTLVSDPPAFRSTFYRRTLRCWLGKILSVVRLIKGIFTFEGGLDYIVWKIDRHTGVKVEIKPWHRRFPLIAAPGLAWVVWRRGGFK
mgnify:FL=1